MALSVHFACVITVSSPVGATKGTPFASDAVVDEPAHSWLQQMIGQ